MQHLTDRLSSKRPVRSGRLTGFLAERNRKVNSRFPALENYAGCQGGGGDCDKLRFGLFCMRFNGCEVMAAYNILRLRGYNTDIREVAYHFETNGSVLPVVIFGRSAQIPEFILYLGKVIPYTAMGLLIVYCLRDVSILGGTHGIPELIAMAVVVASYLWKRNTIVSVVLGTAVYMLLLQMVFV